MTQASPFRRLSQAQRIHAEQEYLDHQGLTYWYAIDRGLPLSKKEEIQSTLRLSLWKACVKRQNRHELMEYGISTIFQNQARSDLKDEYARESRQYGIHARDIYKETSLRDVTVIFHDQLQAKEDSPVFQLPADDDPERETSILQQWEQLTPEQRQYVKLKLEGLDNNIIAKYIGIPRQRVSSLVEQLKGIYGIDDKKVIREPAQSLERDISNLLGISRKAAKSRVYRARSRLGITGDSWDHREQIIEELAA